eukprot:gene52055-15410_t
MVSGQKLRATLKTTGRLRDQQRIATACLDDADAMDADVVRGRDVCELLQKGGNW